ncbi:NeuD/PglB/VioB family sugar acetyltransferase [Streptosporangium subroseum]|uniref:NeuD/PglB/VioB family sugar acetyltransferase n=1 Tax=Streptosporangium subroseum TaxID=106412 RepID=UPI003413BF70
MADFLTGSRAGLVIVGSGGLAREIAQAVPAIGYVDDDPAKHGRLVDGLPVLGGLDTIPAGADVVVGVGAPADRAALAARLPGLRFGAVIHATVFVAATCTVGAGTVLLPQVVLTAAVSVGAHVVVMPHVVLTHDDVIADFVTIAAGVRLAGSVHIGEGVYLGQGALVREGLRIGAGSVIGMGAVVTRDVPPGEVWAGNPARRLERTPR